MNFCMWSTSFGIGIDAYRMNPAMSTAVDIEREATYG